jgi:hypothetical protein
MQKWKYLIERLDINETQRAGAIDTLNKFGEDGRELVSATHQRLLGGPKDFEEFTLFFKKPSP